MIARMVEIANKGAVELGYKEASRTIFEANVTHAITGVIMLLLGSGPVKGFAVVLLIGICTHLGCSPTFRPEVAPADLGKDWVGGYFCPCHGSHYDLAGRVYKSQPAPLNLPVPPHSYETDDLIVIGVDTEKA